MSPHIFSLEGLSNEQLAGFSDTLMPQGEAVIYYPQNGSPPAPHGAIIGPTRVATPVYGPGGTPVMYTQRYPDRGPICDYCAGAQAYIVADGGKTVLPYRREFGGIVDDLNADSTKASAIAAGGAVLTGLALSGIAVWLFYKAGYKSRYR